MYISKELFAAHDLNKNGLLEVGIRIRDHPGLFLKDSGGPTSDAGLLAIHQSHTTSQPVVPSWLRTIT